jgi:HK97 family phage major capsid protein
MSISNQELLRKATLTTDDFGGVGEAPLKIEAADSFITLMTTGQELLSDVQVVRHTAAKWQQATIQFASRIMRPGVQATRLADADRAKPTTGMIEMSTVLVKGEVPVADEVFEDNIEGDSFANTLETLIADRAGFDLEELAVAGDVALAGTDAYLGLLDGWLKQFRGAGGHVVDASSLGTDYQTIFRRLLLSLPARALRNIESDGRYYVPKRMEQMYRDILSSRGTPLGDLSLTAAGELRYQGILIKGVTTIPITAGSPDTTQIVLTNKNNLYAGFRRQLSIESFRDPREGSTSFIITCRFDAKVADVDASATATNVNVEPV